MSIGYGVGFGNAFPGYPLGLAYRGGYGFNGGLPVGFPSRPEDYLPTSGGPGFFPPLPEYASRPASPPRPSIPLIPYNGGGYVQPPNRPPNFPRDYGGWGNVPRYPAQGYQAGPEVSSFAIPGYPHQPPYGRQPSYGYASPPPSYGPKRDWFPHPYGAWNPYSVSNEVAGFLPANNANLFRMSAGVSAWRINNPPPFQQQGFINAYNGLFATNRPSFPNY